MRFKLADLPVKNQEELFIEKPSVHPEISNNCRIKIVGIGGTGCKTVNLMMKGTNFHNMPEVNFVTINTDKQDLNTSKTMYKVQIGIKLTNGLGSGGKPDIGKKAMEENYEDVKEVLRFPTVTGPFRATSVNPANTNKQVIRSPEQSMGQSPERQNNAYTERNVVFVVCGMGGGTGTGASPIIAQIAKEEEAFVIGIVTTPFYFEGSIRTQQANEGIHKLRRCTDALITIPNNKLFSSINILDSSIDKAVKKDNMSDIRFPSPETSKENLFTKANKVLAQLIQELVEIILYPGLVNIDFADVCSIIGEQGETNISIGRAMGEGRAFKAAKQALNFSSLSERQIKKATGILVNITSGNKIDYQELQQIFSIIRESIKGDTNIIFGIRIDEKLQDEIKITLIAGGIKEDKRVSEKENLKIPAFKRRNISIN
ncbi:MAG: cell division protein FtsZ [bacterium]|nr:cell division protein FtsZ [bacterium]